MLPPIPINRHQGGIIKINPIGSIINQIAKSIFGRIINKGNNINSMFRRKQLFCVAIC